MGQVALGPAARRGRDHRARRRRRSASPRSIPGPTRPASGPASPSSASIVLYTLLILIGQFVAQGVVEEKSTRVVELLLATMRPWQLLAGKIIGLGLLGLAQIVAIAVVGVAGALAFDVVSCPAS